MAMERLEVQPLECINNFSVSSFQESNQSTLLDCASSLEEASMLIDNMCVVEPLRSGAHLGVEISESSGLPLHETISHSYVNSCSFDLKDSDISIMKPFFANDLRGHNVSVKDDLNHMEQLSLISSPCYIVSSEQMLTQGGTVQSNCGEESMLMKLDQELCDSYENLCRLCANKRFCLLPLFHGEGLKLNLVEKIHRCLPIKVSDTDDLPTQVCNDCSTKLQICDDLYNASITADGKLQSLKASKTDPLKLFESEHEALEQHDRRQTEVGVQEKVGNDITENALEEVMDFNIKRSDNAAVLNENCSEREWSCDKCNFKAKRKASLIMHNRQHHSNGVEISPKKRDVDEVMSNKSALKSYSCEYCDKSFQSMIKWKRHELSHTRLAMKELDSIEVCKICEEDFGSARELREHYKVVHDEKSPRVYSCDQCDKSYRIAGSLDIHRATHSNEKPYLCDLCGKSFKHVSNLRCHKRSHSDDAVKRRHRCDLCSKAFPSKFHLSEHRNVHLNITPYSCQECDKKFHRRIQLRQHRSIHATEHSYDCPHCGAQFNRRGNMTQHMKRHLGEKKFLCRICKAAFQTLSEVVQHRRSHTAQELMEQFKEKGVYSCEQCSKVFSSIHQLEDHMMVHCGLKFECTLCNKKLSNRRTLEYHIRSFHTGERPYICQFCPEKFLSKEARIVHERIHTGEKPFPCSVCSMSFRCLSNLNQHLSTHQEDRPWACDQCPKRFKRKGVLLVHLRTHTGEKPFCCDLCGRRFTQKNDMLKHQLTHRAPDQAFLCPHCSWTFESHADLHAHIQTHHTPMEVSLEGNCNPGPHSQALVITTDTPAQFPLALMENGNNIIVHQIDSESHSQVLQVDPQILHLSDPLLQSLVPESQVLLHTSSEDPQIIHFDGNSVVLQASESNMLP